MRFRETNTNSGEWNEWEFVGIHVEATTTSFQGTGRWRPMMGLTRSQVFEKMEVGGWKIWLDHSRRYEVIK